VTLTIDNRRNEIQLEMGEIVLPPQKLWRQVNMYKKFDKILLDVVDQGIREVFEETAVQFIYNYLERNSSLRREDIPEKIDIFVEGLEEMLGSGAKVIEKLILKNLYSHLGINYQEMEGYRFSDYIREIEVKLSRSYPKRGGANFEQERLR